MLEYEIKDVVSDYGLYENGELKLILNSRRNAETIKRILEIDCSVPNVATIADFVEVVRCKDCKHRGIKPQCDGRAPDFYCAAGEKRAYEIGIIGKYPSKKVMAQDDIPLGTARITEDAILVHPETLKKYMKREG